MKGITGRYSLLILGIDPGSIKSGWGLIKVEGRKIHYIASGAIKYDSKVPLIARLDEIKSTMAKVIKKYQPDEIALESLIYVKSPTSLIKLAHARAMIISTFIETHRDHIFEYSPNLIKSSTAGHGHADKMSIQKSVRMILGQIDFTTDDESDALAVAICHSLNRVTRQNVVHLKRKPTHKKSKKTGLAASLAHRLG